MMIRVCNKMAIFENKEIKNRKAELSLRPDDTAAQFNLGTAYDLSLIHISEPKRLLSI